MALTRAQTVNVLWYATFYAVVFAAGAVIAHTHDVDMPLYGIGVAVIGGPLFALISKLARKLTVEKYSTRIELHDFRWSWLWSTLWFGGALIGAWALADQLFHTFFLQQSIAAMGLGGMVVGAWFTRVAGRKRDYLRVDVAAGVIEYVTPRGALACPLAELGRFEIQTYRQRVARQHTTHEWYRLVVPGLPKVEFADSVYPGGVQRMQERLQRQVDELRDISAVRRVLAETATGTEYRGTDLTEAMRAAVDDAGRRRAALEALRADPDPEIRQKAHELAASCA